MRRILLTGMSGAGKSTLLAGLSARGFRTVELEGDWCVPQPDGTQMWDEAKVDALLSEEGEGVLIVAGCEANMGAFLSRFDRVILLSAPTEVILDRLATRTTNDFGKSDEERARVLHDIAQTEPLLRRVADVEIDTSGPLSDTVSRIVAELEIP